MPLATLEFIALFAVLCWVASMAIDGRLEWVRTPIDLPLALLLIVIAAQLLLGNRALVNWALGPPTPSPDLLAPFPTRSVVGTAAPSQTVGALFAFLMYAAVYILITSVVKRRRQIERLIKALLASGSVLAFVALLDYAAPDARVIPWRTLFLRATGTFSNPDHFGTWLAMLACLGLGYLLARQGTPTAARMPLTDVLTSRAGREQLLRRWLPLLGIAVMVLALVFTLSRGAIVAFLAGLLIFVFVSRALGRIRWSVMVVSVMLLVALGYGAWIGFGPLFVRLGTGPADMAFKWEVYASSAAMLGDFPMLGIGLGAYEDLYLRYARRMFPLHNEWLQWLLELGLVGGAVIAFGIWRSGKDLVLAHLMGRMACPVGGGAREWAQRRDPFSVGIAVGAVAAIVAFMVHSLVEFPARIPANGALAAACLGLATVTLHTRFGTKPTPLATTRRRDLPARVVRLAVIVAATAAAIPVGYEILRPALVDLALRWTTDEPTLTHANRALAVEPRDPMARAVRARLRMRAALRVWNEGVGVDLRPVHREDERRAQGLAELKGAVKDLRIALGSRPTIPAFHEALAQAYVMLATLDPGSQEKHARAAIAHFQRAVVASPKDAALYQSMARGIVSLVPHAPLDLGLQAARAAIRTNPELLPELVYEFMLFPLTTVQWLQLVPDTAVDRLALADALERRNLVSEARGVYRTAVAFAGSAESTFVRWMLAFFLSKHGEREAALQVLEGALRLDPTNPELHLAKAEALATVGDPDALDAYRAAVANAERMARQQPIASVFKLTDERTVALVKDRIGGTREPRTVRYRQALARHLTTRRLWDQALIELESVLAESPVNATAHFLRGVVLDALGQNDAALEEYRQSIALDGANAQFRVRLAQGLWATEQYYQAINEWGQALARDPNDIATRLALGRAYDKVGEKAQAAEQFRAVLEIAPMNREVRAELARLGVKP